MYITFEGPEACGKSTQAKLLHDKLLTSQRDPLLTKEPGSPHSDLCVNFRSLIFKQDIVEEAALFCFLADRSQHVRTVIAPALRDGRIIISDRSSLSTIIYHIAKQCPDPIDIDYVIGLLPALDLAQMIRPDVCFISSADYDWTLEQLAARNSLDRIEQRGNSFHKHIHSLFDRIVSKHGGYDILCSTLQTHMKLFPKNIVCLPPAHEASVDEIHDFIYKTVINLEAQI
jgi:dTMP kinase